MSGGSKILTLLDDARVWLDLEGALGVDVSMVPDLGVFWGRLRGHGSNLRGEEDGRDGIW